MMKQFSQGQFQGQRVLVREDFNVPFNQDGTIQDDTRLRAALPTIKALLAANAGVILVSHRGRPTPGQRDAALSLAPVADALSNLLAHPVRLEPEISALTVEPGEVVLLENIRFEVGETDNQPALAKQLAGLCDSFVMDAFAVSHRAAASTVGIVEYVKEAYAGPLLSQELAALNAALTTPQRPLVAIVGGSKVSTKLSVLESLLQKVDTLIVGGGIANTFLQAAGQPVGESLVEPALVSKAQSMLKAAQQAGKTILLPIDVVVANDIQASEGTLKPLKAIEPSDKIFDIGERAATAIERVLSSAATIIWNGPVGVFENPAFSMGTQKLAQAVAASPAFSLAGGGETLAAISQFGVTDNVSYISTGGGAFLEWLAGDTLPAVAALEAHGQ